MEFVDPPNRTQRESVTISDGFSTTLFVHQGEGFATCTVDGELPELTDERLASLPLSPIPVHTYCPEARPDMERAGDLQPGQCIKRASLFDWSNDSDRPKWAQVSLHEIEVYEFLEQYPHPNIGRYFGCVTQEGRLTGLCIQKGTSYLSDRLPDFSSEEKTAIYNAIEQAVLHLHQLGLVHNDLTRDNIRLNGDVPFITNFASCKRAGEQVYVPRSDSFSTRGVFETASFERDLLSLARLKEYIHRESTDRF